MKSVAILDLSWCMHKNKHALAGLTVDVTNQFGVTTIPTGHVYGTISDVDLLSRNYDLVVLAVDSPVSYRKEILSSYKADRREITGDAIADYNIYNDLYNILALTTHRDNVFYIKDTKGVDGSGMEADDIIASWIAESNYRPGSSFSVYMNDNDILQVKGVYNWFNKFSGPPIDRVQYLNNKYKLPIDNLPLWVKVVRGDSSDKIPPSLPRFPTSVLNQIALELQTSLDFNQFTEVLSSNKIRNQLSKTWSVKIDEQIKLGEKSQMYLNYKVICPIIKPVKEFEMKSLGLTVEELMKLTDYYKLQKYELGC